MLFVDFFFGQEVGAIPEFIAASSITPACGKFQIPIEELFRLPAPAEGSKPKLMQDCFETGDAVRFISLSGNNLAEKELVDHGRHV